MKPSTLLLCVFFSQMSAHTVAAVSCIFLKLHFSSVWRETVSFSMCFVLHIETFIYLCCGLFQLHLTLKTSNVNDKMLISSFFCISWPHSVVPSAEGTDGRIYYFYQFSFFISHVLQGEIHANLLCPAHCGLLEANLDLFIFWPSSSLYSLFFSLRAYLAV